MSTGLVVLIVVGVVLVLATAGVFYAVGRSEDRERARAARPPGSPRRRPFPRRRDHE